MSLQEQFNILHQQLMQITNFKDTKDRLEYETLYTQANMLNDIVVNATDEQLEKAQYWLNEHQDTINYFIEKYL